MILANSTAAYEARRKSASDAISLTKQGSLSDGESNKDDGWRRHLIQQQIDDELNRRVRDALETPPLERLRRRQQARLKQLAAENSAVDLNAHLDLTDKEKAYYISRRRQQQLRQSQQNEEYDVEKTESTYNRYLTGRGSSGEGSGDNIRTYTGEGVVAPNLRSPQVQSLGVYDPDGWHFTDVPRQRPSYPQGSAPIIPHPKLKNIIHPSIEPLYSSIPVANEQRSKAAAKLPPINPYDKRRCPASVVNRKSKQPVPGATTYDNQVHPYTHKWRGICIVYDSEKFPREQTTEIPKNPLIAPHLVFESRFESGNLRQARRVGQFEYELVLKTDIFTKRHTQWFYFRIQNMVPGVIYKFRIVNLLKRDSLYNHGMRPLLYSERNADENNIGWIRHGHHISYGRNVQHLLCPLLSREIPYYELEFQMEFPVSEDTCYLAHCYPYTHHDLRTDLDTIMADPLRSQYVKKETMCESKAGNSCYLLTVTNFDSRKPKQHVVVSARVHPGESNSSWMMKGLLDFLTGTEPEAVESRSRFVYKIIPMLNPDGVIVGNYRCSLQAKDLNRNYRHPRRDNFPTVFHTKKLVEDLNNSVGVFAYCDFHGHSRKSNVFMYGNNTGNGNVRSFLDDRMLPYCISKAGPSLFSFDSCKFRIRRCKEATGRVVMFRAFNVKNSFTMESTFSGTVIDKNGARHFNQRDFMNAGVIFGKGVLNYSKLSEDKERESAAMLDLTKEITRQLITASQLNITETDKKTIETINQQLRGKLTDENPEDQATDQGVINGAERSKEDKYAAVISILENITEDSMQKCVNLLERLSVETVTVNSIESESSDSDSESESEVNDEKSTKRKKKKSKKKKDKKQVKSDSVNLSHEKMTIKRAQTNLEKHHLLKASTHSTMVSQESSSHPFQTLPMIPGALSNSKGSGGRPDMRKNWTNPYEGRSNGGIPCYSEERSMERATKRMAELQRRMDDKLAMRGEGPLSEQEVSDINSDIYYQELLELHQQKQQIEDQLARSMKTMNQHTGKQTTHSNYHMDFISERRPDSESGVTMDTRLPPAGQFEVVKRSRTEIFDVKHKQFSLQRLQRQKATEKFELWTDINQRQKHPKLSQSRKSLSSDDKSCAPVEFRLPPPNSGQTTTHSATSTNSNPVNTMFSKEYTEMLASRIRANHSHHMVTLHKSLKVNPLNSHPDLD